MWNRINLRIRIYMILTALIFITMMGGLVTVWYTYRMEGLLTGIIDEDVAAFQVAETLEAALVNQKGFVSYYFLDGDPGWLRQLGEYRQIFRNRLNKAHALAKTGRQKEIIRQIESEYTFYITGKDSVIKYYKSGEKQAGTELHQKVRGHFSRVFDLCEAYKNVFKKQIIQTKKENRAEAERLRIIAGVGILFVFFLGVLLAFLLINHILGPIRRLALEADRKEDTHRSGDEIKALSLSVRGLIENVDQTQSELEKSREHLLQAEKMAMVGKLAAGMAHSIRNPFTSVKMRLFSLSRSLELSETQKEDFDVISDEIRHVDTIVQNFLEFSRPPRLKIQKISPSVVVDMAIQLLKHRLKSYDVGAEVVRKDPLPELQADPEQLKEVLVNLIVNACESMEGGGSIVIHEEEAFTSPSEMAAVIRVSDDGPGIPESVHEKIFEPFFSTKEEGTGLGLSIASRIIEEHGGWLDVISEEGKGTMFTIALPIKTSEAGIQRPREAA
ncbi:ATP-binding protein [Desulfococcaceae bacterium HSG8]|nr:ATP-binding protein [Desulfococcaceae bacterium HSG8]